MVKSYNIIMKEKFKSLILFSGKDSVEVSKILGISDKCVRKKAKTLLNQFEYKRRFVGINSLEKNLRGRV